MAEPLLLAARELARGSVSSLPADFNVVATSASSTYLAVLIQSRTAQNCVRLGVFKADGGDISVNSELVDILPESDDSARFKQDEDNWTLVWSPDLKFLVVSGRILRGEGESEGVMWIFAHPEWLADSKTSSSPPLLLRVDPTKYLPAKQWNPSTKIINVFFPTQSGSKLFVLSEDGVWLSMSVQLAKLALIAIDPSASEDTAALFSMKPVMKLTEWHAGVTAACFDLESSTLVVSGGVRDPSADLVEKQASSLSVWKVAGDKENNEVGELLDFTMVVKGRKTDLGEQTNEDKETELDAVVEDSDGLLTSVKSTLFAPLKMMVGGASTETKAIQGSIQHLALAPNGNFVSMVDDLGRVAIRQIDACAEVMKWQTIENVAVNSGNFTVKQVVWLTSDLVALILSNDSVIYSRFIAQSEEEASSGRDSDSENSSSSRSSGHLLFAPTRHFRPAMGAATDGIRTLALAGKGLSSSEYFGAEFTVCEIVVTGDVWAANEVQSLALEPFVELHMDAKKFDDALSTVALYEEHGNAINADDIHRRIWVDYRNQFGIGEIETKVRDLVFLSTRSLQRGGRDAFLGALDHLRAISDKQWVLCECLKLLADDSSANMKKILDLGWDAWLHLNNGDEGAELLQEKADLQRYLYRLETLRLILCEEEGVLTTSVAGDQLFDGAAYALFRSSSVLSTAKQFAGEGRVGALKVLFYRHAWNLIPRWLEILEMIPPSVAPSIYAVLLPAVAAQVEDEGQFCTLSGSDDGDYVAAPVPLIPENRSQDLTDEELAAYEEFSNAQPEQRNATYGDWFLRRVLELDTRYGQLAFAYELSQLATKSLRGWSAEAKKPLEELFLHTERLYKCVYPLHLSACCLLPLSEWSSLSIQDQALIVVGTDEKELSGDVTSIIDRLDAVFVAQRRDHVYSLDEMFSWLARTFSSKASLASLTLAAQLIQRSNPSITFANRWIQSNACLIETALDVVYSVDASAIVGDKVPGVDEDVYMQRHLAVVEQLWTIFQSLPVRKDNDPPDIAQLQVAVDEMEDLMVTMDVLSKYGVVSSPSGLKYRVLASSDTGSVGPQGLLEQMCDFVLPGEYSANEESGDGSQWLEVLQDAVKLKEHAFGERLNQEMILDVILKHLLAPDRAYVDAAQNLVNHWITADVEAVEHVLDELLTAIRVKLDSVTGYSEDASANIAHESALGCINIVRQLLSLPLWDEGDRAVAGAKQHYEEVLAVETDRAHACELLDLLTYGAVKMSPSQLRSEHPEGEEKGNTLLDAVCQVFVSNPSNYKPSVRAREWLEQHEAGKTGLEGSANVWNEPLAAVMYLAKLLRVDSQKLEIWMKGAYAALYCMDYDVAYDLTMQVINGIPAEVDAAPPKHSGGNKLTLVHLISLVLDLVSASTFGSWSKKRKLCVALFSVSNVSSSDLFGHQVTDLVLSWLEKIEAIQALMVELGLSDKDLEQRRLAGGKTSSSTEAVLLNELKVVIDLLQEERNDRQFLLRLLQRGLQLIQVMLNNEDAEGQANNESVPTFLQQMVKLCVEEAVALASASDSGDWQQYLELGLSYLMLWGDLTSDDQGYEAFCTEVLSSAFIESSTSDDEPVRANESVARRLHHFFLLQADQAKEVGSGSERETLIARRKRFDSLSSSYETTRRAASSTGPHTEAFGDLAFDEEAMDSQLLVSKQRYQIYVKLTQQCHERLVSQKKSQELEHMSSFFNTELDLERFSTDETYRNEKIILLATKKETFQLSRQFATKYGIDEYECVLAYIKHALLLPSDSKVGRRDQLDQAFAIEKVDIMEEALQRPASFGDFLLKRETAGRPSLYEALDGTDHVGVLLVLRMVLECSKRLYQEAADSPSKGSLFPLPKASTDRITLLFMCLKKLKDIGDSLDSVEAVDLKLIGAASTTTELLTPLASSRTDPQTVLSNRDVAVEAVRPLLTGKTIKFVTKILRKLHRVTPSAMVMIYLNGLLTEIWREHGSGTGALSADLAVYAYESCVPCLSVLSNEHLMLFHCLFLDGSSGKALPELVSHLNLTEEFYGQGLSGLQHFGALLTPQKRVELVTDTLTLFHTKYNSWQTSGSRSNVSSASSTSSSSSTSWDPAQYKRKEQELQYLERELAENVCYLVLSEVDNSDLAKTSLDPVVHSLKTRFAMDSLQTANEEVALDSILAELSQRVRSVELASLVMELTLRAGGSKATDEAVTSTITQSYQNAALDLVQRCLGEGQTVQWANQLVWTWVTGSNSTSTKQMEELQGYLEAVCSPGDGSSAVYERVVTMLSQSPSTMLKEIGLGRRGNLQTPTEGITAAVRGAVLSQWELLISSREEDHKWTEAAVLGHVLVTQSADEVKWNFGLHVKAVWSALLTKHKLDESPAGQRIFDVPSHDIADHFAAVFEELLAFVEACAGEQNPKALKFAEMATVALSNVLVHHDDLRRGSEGAAQRSASTWKNEQQRAVEARVQAQFQVGTSTAPQNSSPNEDATCWSALFARGVWGAGLLSWYITFAYAELSSEEEVTEAVILAHWEASNVELAVQLLLMCPFDGLRAKHTDHALSVLRQLPQGSPSWATAMELALLRFDVAVLMQHGLHSSIVTFLVASNKTSELWTSSGDFVVCALVTQGEFAAAGRLTCALRHAHPLLWDLENARLLLANYLRSLASLHKSNSLQHQVYVQTSHRFADALL